MDRFFVVITVLGSNGRLISDCSFSTENDPRKRFVTTHQDVCRINGLLVEATSVIFYSAEKMPAT